MNAQDVALVITLVGGAFGFGLWLGAGEKGEERQPLAQLGGLLLSIFGFVALAIILATHLEWRP